MEKDSRHYDKSQDAKNDKYQDIINLCHHVSANHEPMTIYNRAAQFSPFAALTGFEGVIHETARLTEQKVELDEAEKEMLDEKLKIISRFLIGAYDDKSVFIKENNLSVVSVTYFQADEKKDGGAYLTCKGNMKKIDPLEQVLIMENGSRIPIGDIVDLSGDIFKVMDTY